MGTRKVYVDNIKEEMCAFEERLMKLKNKVYLSDRLKKMVEALSYINKNFLKILTSEFKDRQKKGFELSSEAKLVVHIWQNNILAEIATRIEETDVKSQPLEILNVLREFISMLDDDKFDILTKTASKRSQFAFNELWREVSKLVSHINIDLADEVVEPNFFTLTYPYQYKNDVLYAGIYVHEMAHYLEKKRKIADEIYTKNLSPKKLSFLQNAIINLKSNKEISYSQLTSLLNSKKKPYVVSWIRETIADFIAVYLLGPAYLFACRDLVSFHFGRSFIEKQKKCEEISPTHPNWSLRYNSLIRLIEEMNLKSVMNKYGLFNNLEKFSVKLFEYEKIQPVTFDFTFSGIKYRITIDGKVIQSFENFLKDIFGLAKGEVDKLVGDLKINADQLKLAFELASKRIKIAVPPNELNGKPVDCQTIINAGWFAYILHKKEISKFVDLNREPITCRALINRLVQYALHVSKIHRQWEGI